MTVPLELKEVRFEMSPAEGLRDEKFRRQDPSNILKIGSKYHLWYAKHPAELQWNQTRTAENIMEIWMATSLDGRKWFEEGAVLPVQDGGRISHARASHAPHVVPWEGRYYLFFSFFYGRYDADTLCGEKHIGLAVGEAVGGPYKILEDSPVLSPFAKPGHFDHYLIDDPCVIRRGGKFWLYYKGRNSKRSECRLGVVVAENITGPYKRVMEGPVCETDWHTGCVWPHREGVAGIIDGQKGKSVAYSPDGLCFETGSSIPEDILDVGVFCPDAFSDTDYGHGVEWGLSVGWDDPEYIYRCDAKMVAPEN